MSCVAPRQAPRPRRREPGPALGREATGRCGGEESTSCGPRHTLMAGRRIIERCCTLWFDPMRWLDQGRGFASEFRALYALRFDGPVDFPIEFCGFAAGAGRVASVPPDNRAAGFMHRCRNPAVGLARRNTRRNLRRT